MSNVYYQEKFEDSHNGPSADQGSEMVRLLGVGSFDELVEQTVPKATRRSAMALPPALSEVAYLEKVAQIDEKNKVFKSYIGQGYYDVILPGVIQRNLF